MSTRRTAARYEFRRRRAGSPACAAPVPAAAVAPPAPATASSRRHDYAKWDNIGSSSDEDCESEGGEPLPHALTRSTSIVAGLPYVRRYLQSGDQDLLEIGACLVAEAESGRRREPLSMFFNAAEEALAEMATDRNPISVHQPTEQTWHRCLRRSMTIILRMREQRKIILRPQDSGFFAAFLAVVDNLVLAPEEMEFEVNWRLRGDEKHFTYAPPAGNDPCVWNNLFEPLHRPAAPTWQPSLTGEEAVTVTDSRWNAFLLSRFRWIFRTHSGNAAQRMAYHKAYARHVRLRHPSILAEYDGLGAALRAGVSIGVHKRVDTPGTREYQGARSVYSSADFIEALRRVARRMGRPLTHVFLATDDSRAEAAFRASEFGHLLHVRSGVQRVPGGLNADGTLNEVHIRSPHNPGCSLADAVDVLADAMLLSSCGAVLHMDSNVTSAVGIINPTCLMCHVVDVLGGDMVGGEPSARLAGLRSDRPQL